MAGAFGLQNFGIVSMFFYRPSRNIRSTYKEALSKILLNNLQILIECIQY